MCSPPLVTEQIQTNQEKEGLSTYAKLGIGIGVTTAIAIGVDFLFCKGKHIKNLWGKLKGNNSRPNDNPPSLPPSNTPVATKKTNFFEQRGLKINKEVVSNADGTLYTGSIEHTNKNGERFILEYKDGMLQTSEKYTRAGEFVSRKKYTQGIETGYDPNKVPYPIKKRYMFEYNKDGKIINGLVVIENECSHNKHTFVVNNKYRVSKKNKEITITRFADKDGKKYELFDIPFDNELDARWELGRAILGALISPFKKHYTLSK